MWMVVAVILVGVVGVVVTIGIIIVEWWPLLTVLKIWKRIWIYSLITTRMMWFLGRVGLRLITVLLL